MEPITHQGGEGVLYIKEERYSLQCIQIYGHLRDMELGEPSGLQPIIVDNVIEEYDPDVLAISETNCDL